MRLTEVHIPRWKRSVGKRYRRVRKIARNGFKAARKKSRVVRKDLGRRWNANPLRTRRGREIALQGLAPDTRSGVGEALKAASAVISPNDDMLWNDLPEHYFRAGASALENVLRALEETSAPEPRRILDLPCGHGRVMRLLRAAFPDARIFGCDLLLDGVDFCARKLGAIPVPSEKDPADIPIRDEVGLIWCGSLVTHLEDEAFRRFLRFFAERLSPGGIAVFSAHGEEAVRRMTEKTFSYGLDPGREEAMIRSYRDSGFGYANYRKTDDYGISLSSQAWITEACSSLPHGVRLAASRERAWDDHHDIHVLQRPGGEE